MPVIPIGASVVDVYADAVYLVTNPALDVNQIVMLNIDCGDNPDNTYDNWVMGKV